MLNGKVAEFYELSSKIGGDVDTQVQYKDICSAKILDIMSWLGFKLRDRSLITPKGVIF